MKKLKKEKKVPKAKNIEFCLMLKHAKNIWIVTNTPIKKQKDAEEEINEVVVEKINVNVNINYNL